MHLFFSSSKVAGRWKLSFLELMVAQLDQKARTFLRALGFKQK